MGALTAEWPQVEVITGAVVVDLDHTARDPFPTGIRRASREAARRWVRDHGAVMIGWTEGFKAFRRLSPQEYSHIMGGTLVVRGPPGENGAMSSVRLRAVREEDLDHFAAMDTVELDPWNNFEIGSSNRLHRRFAQNGGIDETSGMLSVETVDGDLVGSVSWHTTQHGPSAGCRAINIGISLFPEYRGRGYGSEAQRLLAAYLFSSRLIERVEAETDAENGAEQRALEKAGFTREGLLRHAQYRDGEWRDVVMYSRLRSDHP
jgi:RimJ/RimL family protein N-acetyltransferase